MTLSQMIVASWAQFALAAALVLFLAHAVLGWLVQPADRIRLILLSLVTVIAIPLFAAVGLGPTWRLNWISRLDQVRPSRNAALIRLESGPPSVALTHSSSQEARATKDANVLNNVSELPAPPVVSSPPRSAEASEVRGTTALSLWDAAAIAVVAAHGLAVLYLLAEWTLGYVLLYRLRFAASPSTLPLEREWHYVTRGRGKHVRLFISRSIDTPLIFDWFRPVVLMPADLVATGGASLTFCLAHEWSHIERGDMLAWNFVRTSQVFLWFVPSYWTLRTDLRLSQDMLADDRASGARTDAVQYSELLLSFAKKRMNVPSAAALTFLHHPSQLTKRIKMLLLQSVSVRSSCSWKFSFASGIAAILLAIVFSAVRLDATRADDAKQEPPKQESAAENQQAAPAKEEKKEVSATPVGPLKYTCTVVDKETGKGIPNARVVVRRSNSHENRVIEESKHTTDADGNYVVDIPEEQVADRYMYIELDVEHDDYAPRKGFGYSLGMIMKNEKLGERPFFERTELYASEPVTGTVVVQGKPVAGVKVQSFSMASQSDFNSMSFNDTLSDDEGRFRLNVHKGADAIIWVIPKDFAITEKFLGKQRGDMGLIALTPGVRISGRVLGADGKPMAGLAVNIDFTGERNTGGLPVATSIRRGAISDADGRFHFDPLAPGDYSIKPDEHLSDPLRTRDRTRYDLPAVFISKKVTINEEKDPAPIDIQAVPHILFNAQIVDGAGKKTGGHEFFLFGELDGTWWFGQGRPNKEGTISMKVPHGLQQARVQLMTNEHGALRYRKGKGQPLKNETQNIEFGTLNDDVDDFEIVRYKAPLVLISAVDEAKQPIKDFRVAATYPWGQQRYILEGEARSDMSFEKQNDGRYRTSQMLPDEEVTFTVTAKGYQSVSEKITLPEGETKELMVTLKKSEGEPAVAEKKPE